MGVKDSGDETGRRRTRSSTKPPVELAPSPPKRERKTPAAKTEKKETPAKGLKKFTFFLLLLPDENIDLHK